MLSFAGIVLGILLLIGGGAALVAGASQIATRHGISPMIVGLTIVAFGTSAPELVINVLGALQGQSELAFGNVIGSNIGNLGLVLGLAAMFGAIDLKGQVVRREVPLLLLITTIIIVMALDGVFEGLPAHIGRSDALVLLLLFGIFLYITVQDFVRDRRGDPLMADIEANPIIRARTEGKRYWLMMGLGFLLLFIGGEVTITNSVDMAEKLGVSTAVIGLFVVAIGTSMPELVTSIIAAMRRESDLALGNIIGSNLFNSMIVLPASGLAAPVTVPSGGVLDLVFSWLLAAVLIPVFFLGKARLSRRYGLLLVLVYLSYAVVRVAVI
jgi:cation:H+ antiporter